MKRFDDAVSSLPATLRDSLQTVDARAKRQTFEVRLRAGMPVVLFGTYGARVLQTDGLLRNMPDSATLYTDRRMIEDCFQKLCAYSVHTYQNEIVNGFVTLNNGHRVGLCGTAVTDSTGRLSSVREVSSLNLRIAREQTGCAEPLLRLLCDTPSGAVLIAGPPASGKTTLLRDLVRLLSGGERGFKVCVADERMELAAMRDAAPQNDVGWNCDVLSGYPKDAAIEIALRALSPEVLVCDELVTRSELEAVRRGVNAGVRFVASVHASSREDLLHRKTVEALLDMRAFTSVVLLKGGKTPCVVDEIFDAKELLNELYARRVGLVL